MLSVSESVQIFEPYSLGICKDRGTDSAGQALICMDVYRCSIVFYADFQEVFPGASRETKALHFWALSTTFPSVSVEILHHSKFSSQKAETLLITVTLMTGENSVLVIPLHN